MELNKARPPANNVDKGMMKALSDLRKDEDIVILPADKGNATVVLDKKDYTEKMNQMLEGETYKAITKDPTTRVETKITTALKQLEKRGYISEKERKYLSPQCSNPPQIYGLPKIHKEGLPLRPIVSAIGSPTYRLAKSLARILTPLAGKTSSFVKNSTDFAKHIREIQLEEEDRMISFDVVSLFTKVPVAGAIDAISALLGKDNSFEDLTAIPARDICNLTELCLRSTYFQFQDRFFEQVDGAAMGSPLSPVVANLYMEAFETKALELAPLQPKMWIRYVDDTFVLWPHGEEELSAFHNHLNSINHSIQFTCEKESEGTLPFLDVELKRMGEKVSTGVYRKPTHTNRYIHFSSHHHPRIKIGVVQCLKRRADTICDEHSANREAKMLQSAFEANGYPRRVIQRTLRQPPHPTRGTDINGEQEKPTLLVLPYLKNTSETIQRTCKQLGIKAVFKSQGTLRQTLTRVKTPRPEMKKKNVIYEIPCKDCNMSYIGETGRSLQKRMTEHKAAVRRGDQKNGVAVHVQKYDHRVDWEAARHRARTKIMA